MYSVKIVNPKRKSDYTVRKLRTNIQFLTVSEVFEELKNSLEINASQLGYIEPGHGLKGKQRWITEDEDLETMYECFKGKREIVLWCSPSPKGKSLSTFNEKENEDCLTPPPKKKSAIAKKISEVEDIIKELKRNHASKYSVEQLNVWAHLIHVEKHASKDTPPDLPYFRGTKKRKLQDELDNCPVTAPSLSITSPGKRVSLRSECIEQLGKWHSLLEKGAISQSHYDELQSVIMKDMFPD